MKTTIKGRWTLDTIRTEAGTIAVATPQPTEQPAQAESFDKVRRWRRK
jgi:hypothetical protein